MAAILIAYDLHKLGQRYHALRELIERQFPVHWNRLESTYIVITELSPADVLSSIKAPLDANDTLLVIDAGPGWDAHGFDAGGINWLERRL